jgi:hypothetical protein
MATLGACMCMKRYRSQLRGDFVRTPEGWRFTAGPSRAMSAKARYYAFADRGEFPHEDHTGEPYYWTTCPFCGGDLPGSAGWGPPSPQADGENSQ